MFLTTGAVISSERIHLDGNYIIDQDRFLSASFIFAIFRCSGFPNGKKVFR